MSTRYSSKSSFSEFRTLPLSLFLSPILEFEANRLCGRALKADQRTNLAPGELRSNFSSSKGNNKRAIIRDIGRKKL